MSGHQDQVDTLTFQNRSLRDRAKRFEEALRKSTDEQILVTAALNSTGPCADCFEHICWIRAAGVVKWFLRLVLVLTHVVCCCQDALAPYKHIDEDLKSLKEVLEMKNQQIHQQEQKISELEKIVGFKCDV